MTRILLSFLPFMVCLFWLITFLLHYPKSDPAKRLLTGFLGVCTLLYFCHARYFTDGGSPFLDGLWTLCTLSVYPIYYIYICRLVSHSLSPTRLLLILLPGVAVAVWRFLVPDIAPDIARKLLNMVQILLVGYYGYHRLQAFDKELANTYASTEGYDTRAIKYLLIAFVIISICSAVANTFGRQFFMQSEWLLLVVVCPFSILLYALSYIGFTRQYSMEQFIQDSQDDAFEAETPIESNEIGRRLELAVVGQQLYLTPNLKIGDVVREVGICRTHISTYLNRTMGLSFSDYINRLRVDYAKTLLDDAKEVKIIVIAQQSGFASEQSFYRNFTKFTGMTTSEWIRQHGTSQE